MALQKSWAVKVFGQDGVTAKKTIPSANLRSNPSFPCKINGGFGECVLDLVTDLKHSPLVFKFDSFGEGTIIAHSFIVDVYESDPVNAPTGRRIYRGYVSKYEPYLEQGGMEGVRVTCLGLGSLPARSFYKSGAAYTVTHTGVDPQAVGEAAVDHFNTIFGGSLITYTHGTSTQTVGTNVSYTFTDQKWSSVFETVRKLAGQNWWWKIDENGLYWLQAKPSSATHKFTLGKNIKAISAPKDAEKVVNDVQVRYASSGTYDKSDATSQSTYGTGATPSGKFSEIISDATISDATTAQQRGDGEVNTKKTALNTATITIEAQDYDIESIKVGQSCKILNYDLSCTFWSNNLLIVATSYDGDTCQVQVEGVVNDFGREMQNYLNTSGGSGTVTGSGGTGTGAASPSHRKSPRVPSTAAMSRSRSPMHRLPGLSTSISTGYSRFRGQWITVSAERPLRL